MNTTARANFRGMGMAVTDSQTFLSRSSRSTLSKFFRAAWDSPEQINPATVADGTCRTTRFNGRTCGPGICRRIVNIHVSKIGEAASSADHINFPVHYNCGGAALSTRQRRQFLPGICLWIVLGMVCNRRNGISTPENMDLFIHHNSDMPATWIWQRACDTPFLGLQVINLDLIRGHIRHRRKPTDHVQPIPYNNGCGGRIQPLSRQSG